MLFIKAMKDKLEQKSRENVLHKAEEEQNRIEIGRGKREEGRGKSFIKLVAKLGVFDVDDSILNTSGGLLGIFIFSLLKKI